VLSAIRGGARVVQYRDKSVDLTRREHQSRALLQICRQHEIPLIINDDVELAFAIGADGCTWVMQTCPYMKLGHGWVRMRSSAQPAMHRWNLR